MIILKYLKTGLVKAFRAWKGVLVIWFCSLLLTGLATLPLKAGINGMFGTSMITELLKDGFNLDAFVGPQSGTRVLISSFTSSIMLVMFFGFLVNVFLSGGMFSLIRAEESSSFSKHFYGGAGSNFWSFLVIALISSFIIIVVAGLVVGIPAAIASSGRSSSDAALVNTLIRMGIVFTAILPVFILVADYARAWKAAHHESGTFRSVGVGFRLTFRNFFSSYLVMALMMVISFLVLLLAYNLVGKQFPSSRSGIFLLFLLSQLIFILKVIVRAARYGSVTAMLEQHGLTG